MSIKTISYLIIQFEKKYPNILLKIKGFSFQQIYNYYSYVVYFCLRMLLHVGKGYHCIHVYYFKRKNKSKKEQG